MTRNDDSNAGYLGLIKGNRAFRYLWAGQVISLTGDWFNLIASAALIATLTQSGTAVGGLFVVRMLAPFLVSPFAGVVADRYNRKAILMSTDILRCFVVLGFVLVREPPTCLADLPADHGAKRFARVFLPGMEFHSSGHHSTGRARHCQCLGIGDLVGDAGFWRGARRAGLGRCRRLPGLCHRCAYLPGQRADHLPHALSVVAGASRRSIDDGGHPAVYRRLGLLASSYRYFRDRLAKKASWG